MDAASHAESVRTDLDSERGNGFVLPMDYERVAAIAAHVEEIIKLLNLDPSDDNLRSTPERVARMYLEVFSSLERGREPRITVFENTENYSSMVTVKDMPFYSMCAHHFVPFFGVAHVAYIPTNRIVGLSKIPRIVKFYSRMPQLQERLTEQIADYIDQRLEPRGTYVVIEARHLCMEMRGIESEGSKTVTSALRGCFAKPEIRQEFLDLLKIARWEGH